MMKTLDPDTTWYHTADPPKSTWKSVKQPAGLISAYRRTCTIASCVQLHDNLGTPCDPQLLGRSLESEAVLSKACASLSCMDSTNGTRSLRLHVNVTNDLLPHKGTPL